MGLLKHHTMLHKTCQGEPHTYYLMLKYYQASKWLKSDTFWKGIIREEKWLHNLTYLSKWNNPKLCHLETMQFSSLTNTRPQKLTWDDWGSSLMCPSIKSSYLFFLVCTTALFWVSFPQYLALSLIFYGIKTLSLKTRQLWTGIGLGTDNKHTIPQKEISWILTKQTNTQTNNNNKKYKNRTDRGEGAGNGLSQEESKPHSCREANRTQSSIFSGIEKTKGLITIQGIHAAKENEAAQKKPQVKTFCPISRWKWLQVKCSMENSSMPFIWETLSS